MDTNAKLNNAQLIVLNGLKCLYEVLKRCDAELKPVFDLSALNSHSVRVGNGYKVTWNKGHHTCVALFGRYYNVETLPKLMTKVLIDESWTCSDAKLEFDAYCVGLDFDEIAKNFYKYLVLKEKGLYR